MTTQAPPFDTYRTIQRLIKSGGFKPEQAEAIAEAVTEGLTGGVATSADMANLRADMAGLETRLTNQMWKIALVGVALVGAMIAFAPKFFSG